MPTTCCLERIWKCERSWRPCGLKGPVTLPATTRWGSYELISRTASFVCPQRKRNGCARESTERKIGFLLSFCACAGYFLCQRDDVTLLALFTKVGAQDEVEMKEDGDETVLPVLAAFSEACCTQRWSSSLGGQLRSSVRSESCSQLCHEIADARAELDRWLRIEAKGLLPEFYRHL